MGRALVLPPNEKNDLGEIIIHTGQRFCRVEERSRVKYVYDTQNFLASVKSRSRSHLASVLRPSLNRGAGRFYR
ncbi:hypothetical protein BDW60DRAFT_200764 [Aspergillus nidulans var. acristatus]